MLNAQCQMLNAKNAQCQKCSMPKMLNAKSDARMPPVIIAEGRSSGATASRSAPFATSV
jgi:hypothetical protein